MNQIMAELPAASDTTRPRIDQLLVAITQKLRQQAFSSLPELSSLGVLAGWDLPSQDSLPTMIVMRPDNAPLHAGERIKLILAASRFIEELLAQLREELNGVGQLADELGKRIQTAQRELEQGEAAAESQRAAGNTAPAASSGGDNLADRGDGESSEHSS